MRSRMLVALALVSASPALADVVRLVDGRELEGEVIEREGGVELVRAEDSLFIAADQVVGIRRDEPGERPVSRIEVSATAGATGQWLRSSNPKRAPYARARVAPKTAGDARVLGTALEVEAAWEAAAGEQAERLLGDEVRTWDAPGPGVTVGARFDGALMSLEVRRPEGGPALAVAFPPGLYGEFVAAASEDRDPARSRLDPLAPRTRPRPAPRSRGYQDLALLRAPVLVLCEGETFTSVRVPVACASFSRGGPPSAPCELRAFPRESVERRLAATLCSGAEPPLDAPAQLAVWIVTKEGPTAPGQVSSHTFGTHERVDESWLGAAQELIASSGLRPTDFPMFGGLYASAVSE